MEHLEELRVRIIRILAILVVSFSVCYYFASEISEFLLLPLRQALGTTGKVVFTGLLDKVLAELQIAFWACVFFASPLWFREAWLFIKPGLYGFFCLRGQWYTDKVMYSSGNVHAVGFDIFIGQIQDTYMRCRVTPCHMAIHFFGEGV